MIYWLVLLYALYISSIYIFRTGHVEKKPDWNYGGKSMGFFVWIGSLN